MIPIIGNPRDLFGATTPVPSADKKVLADVALETARARGATYADVRIGRYLNQFVFARSAAALRKLSSTIPWSTPI